MRIAFVSQPFIAEVPPTRDSIGLIVHQLARQLARSHDVIVYSRGGHDAGVREQTVDGIRYRQVPQGPDLESRLERWRRRVLAIAGRFFSSAPGAERRRPWFASSLSHVPYAVRVGIDLRRQRADVVHVMNYSQFVPILRALHRRGAVGLHMECDWLTQLDPEMVRSRLRRADFVVGCSEFISRQIREVAPAAASRVQTVYKGADPDRFRRSRSNEGGEPTTASPTILFVGRLSPEKGVHVLVEAFAKVLERCPEARLRIVGAQSVCPKDFIVALSDDPIIGGLVRFYSSKADGSDYVATLMRGVPERVAERITFVGPVPNEGLPRHYDESALFAFPSVCHEGFPLTVVEALASGRPVVAARAGGVQDVLEAGDCGTLVDRDDADALANAIVQLLRDDGRRSAMSAAARRRVEAGLTWAAGAETLETIYAEALRRRPGQPAATAVLAPEGILLDEKKSL